MYKLVKVNQIKINRQTLALFLKYALKIVGGGKCVFFLM